MDVRQPAPDRVQMSRGLEEERKAWLRAFGRAVRQTRLRSKLTQEELGYRTALDPTYVSGIERGRRNPTLWVIRRLAKGLQITATELITLAEASFDSA